VLLAVLVKLTSVTLENYYLIWGDNVYLCLFLGGWAHSFLSIQ